MSVYIKIPMNETEERKEKRKGLGIERKKWKEELSKGQI